MIREDTFTKLSQMRMHGLATGLRHQLETDTYDALAFEDRVGMLVDGEWTEREGRRLTRPDLSGIVGDLRRSDDIVDRVRLPPEGAPDDARQDLERVLEIIRRLFSKLDAIQPS